MPSLHPPFPTPLQPGRQSPSAPVAWPLAGPTDTARRGADRTLVALHCSGASGRAWSAYGGLVGDDTALITPDLLGSGGAAWPVSRSLTLDEEAERLAPLLDADPRGVHLLGHSYGGAVAMQLALRYPHKLRSLTLYEPVRFGVLDAGEPAWQEIDRVGPAVAALARAGQPEAAAARFVDYWSGQGTWQAMSPSRRAGVAAGMPKVAAEFDAIFADRTPAAAFAALPMPVTLLVGGRSPLSARGVVERLASACPAWQLRTLPACGHMGPLEQPAAVAAALPWVASHLARFAEAA